MPHGVVVWLHAPGGFKWPELLARWKPLCDRHDLILVAPKSADAARWNPGELALVDRLLAEVTTTYNVDPARVVVHGYEGGGSLAFMAALRNRDVIRAVAAVEAVLPGQPPENDPLHRLAIYVGKAGKSPHARRIERGRGRDACPEDSGHREEPGRGCPLLESRRVGGTRAMDRYVGPNLTQGRGVVADSLRRSSPLIPYRLSPYRRFFKGAVRKRTVCQPDRITNRYGLTCYYLII